MDTMQQFIGNASYGYYKCFEEKKQQTTWDKSLEKPNKSFLKYKVMFSEGIVFIIAQQLMCACTSAVMHTHNT